MLTFKKLSMGMSALAMLLSHAQSVNLESCCGGNNADINLSFEVNVASLLRQATASLPADE